MKNVDKLKLGCVKDFFRFSILLFMVGFAISLGAYSFGALSNALESPKAKLQDSVKIVYTSDFREEVVEPEIYYISIRDEADNTIDVLPATKEEFDSFYRVVERYKLMIERRDENK